METTDKKAGSQGKSKGLSNHKHFNIDGFKVICYAENFLLKHYQKCSITRPALFNDNV